MREKITISKPSGYSKTASGQVSSGGTTTEGTYFANVRKGVVNQEITGDQNVLENSYTFEIRTQEDTTFTKEHQITWNSETYQIINISNQEPYQRFTRIIAISVE